MDRDPEVFQCLRVLRLLNPQLLGFSSYQPKAKEREWLTREIVSRGDVPESDIAQKLVQQLLSQEDHPIDGLFNLARDLVTIREGLPRSSNQAVWHRIGREIDTDLIIAARLALESPPPTEHIARQLEWPSILAAKGLLSEIVQMGELADTHVHLNGVLPASFFWVALMSKFTPLTRFADWNLDGRLWPDCLDDSQTWRESFFEHLTGTKIRDWEINPFEEQNQADEASPVEPFVDYFMRFLIPRFLDRIRHNPILGERLLLWQALWSYKTGAWPKKKTPPQSLLTAKFLHYLRCRNSFIHHLTYHPLEPGLPHFRRVFGRQRMVTGNSASRRNQSRVRRLKRAFLNFERFRMRHALRYQFSDPTDKPWARDYGANLTPGQRAQPTPWRPARQVELRVTPYPGHLQMRFLAAHLQGYRDFVTQDRDAPLVRMGLVFHVHKRPGTTFPKDAQWSLQGIDGLLRGEPGLRPFLVGLDAAGSERAVAPRHLVPFLNGKEFRQWQRKVRTQGRSPIRMRRTCHVGEDFPDQLTGLRWMDDAARFLDLRPGERMGHGLALAWEPHEWYRQHPVIHKPLMAHLIDLIWAISMAKKQSRELGLTFNSELANLAHQNWEQFIAKSNLKLKDKLTNIPKQYSKYTREEHLITLLGLTPLQTLIDVKPDENYITVVKGLRERVRQRIVATDIVLEICPTSNLLVGGFKGYEDLPYLNLNRTGLDDPNGNPKPVLLSLNTDNPGHFKTTIANEYRVMAEALKNRGYSSRQATRWLEEARQVGLASTFIPPWSPPTKAELEVALNEALYTPKKSHLSRRLNTEKTRFWRRVD